MIRLGLSGYAALTRPTILKPELRDTIVSFNVNMYGLTGVAGVKEEAVRPNRQDRRHRLERPSCQFSRLTFRYAAVCRGDRVSRYQLSEVHQDHARTQYNQRTRPHKPRHKVRGQ